MRREKRERKKRVKSKQNGASSKTRGGTKESKRKVDEIFKERAEERKKEGRRKNDEKGKRIKRRQERQENWKKEILKKMGKIKPTREKYNK